MLIRRLLGLAILATTVATVCCVIPVSNWGIELFLSFRVQYAVTGLALAVIAIFFKGMRRWMVLCIACSAVLLSPMVKYFSADSLEGLLISDPIHILHWNTWRDIDSNEDMEWVFENEQPDLAFFMEVTDQEREEFGVDARKYRVWRMEDWIVVARRGMDVVESPNFVRLAEEPAVEMKIRWNGEVVRVLSIHPPSPQTPRRLKSRDAHFVEMAARIKTDPLPCIVIGDFNTVPWSPVFQELLSGADLQNSMLGFGLHPTWPNHNLATQVLQIPIDHCLISKEFHVLGRRVGDSLSSNHRPLMVKLAMAKSEI